MIAGTPLEACYLWSLFYLLGLQMLELMTVSLLMGQAIAPTSRFASKVLGRAKGRIKDFPVKFRYCMALALTQALIGSGVGNVQFDVWDCSNNEAEITSKRNPFCRWLWAELTRLVSSIFNG